MEDMATDMATDTVMDTVTAMPMRINHGGRNFSLLRKRRNIIIVIVPKQKLKETCLYYLERKNTVW